MDEDQKKFSEAEMQNLIWCTIQDQTEFSEARIQNLIWCTVMVCAGQSYSKTEAQKHFDAAWIDAEKYKDINE